MLLSSSLQARQRRSSEDMDCAVTPWAFLHPSASCLARGSLGEPFEECRSPSLLLPSLQQGAALELFHVLGQAWSCWRGVHSLCAALVFASGAEKLPLSPSETGEAEGGPGERGGRRRQISMSHKGHKRSDSCNCPRIKRLLQCWLP